MTQDPHRINPQALELIMRDVLGGVEEFALRGSVYWPFEVVDPDRSPQWNAHRSQGPAVILQFRQK